MPETKPDTTVKTGTVIKKNPVDLFKDYMLERAELESGTLAYDVAASQIDKIMAAQTEAEIWDADKLPMSGARDLVDVELAIESYTVHKSSRSDFETPFGFFIVVHANSLETGEELVFNTGAPLLMSKIRALEAVGLMTDGKTVECVIRGFQATNGTVLKLFPIPKRAIKSDSK